MVAEMKTQGQTNHVVALFGEILADIFPDQSVLGGAPFNVARHLRAFNMHPVLITRIGNDALRDDLLREMHSRGLATTGVQFDPVYPTGQVQVFAENGNNRYEILPDQAYDHIHAGITHMVTMSLKPDLVYFGTLAQRNMESRLALDKFLTDGKCPRFLDINLRKPWFNKHTVRRSLLRADIVKMNEDELAVVSKYFKLSGQNNHQRALDLLQRFELKQLLVTCSAAGSWLVNEHKELVIADPVELSHPMVDTVGAGDAFAAVFIIGLLNSWDMQITLQRATEFASAICGIRGAAPQSLNFYIPFKKEWSI